MTQHSVIYWDNLDVVLSDKLEHNIDNDATKEISLVTDTNECSIISLNTNLVELNKFSGNCNIYLIINSLKTPI